MTLIANLSLLVLDLVALGVLALVLHWSSRRFGLAPLLIFVSGLVSVLHSVGSLPVFLEVAGLEFAVANVTVVPVILMVLLVLYEAEGTAVARTTILGIVGLSFLVVVLQWSRQLHLVLPGGMNRVGIPADSAVFARTVSMTLASMAAFTVSLAGVAVVQQWLRNRVTRLPVWILPGPALLAALTADDVIFRLMAFGWTGFLATFPGGLPGKAMGALVLWPLTAVYLVRFAPRFAGYVGDAKRHSLNVVFGTYRQREMDLLATEKRHRETRQHLQTVVDHAPIVFFSVDTDGVFTLSEGAGLAALGLEPGQVVGASAFELFPEVEVELRRALQGRAGTSVVNAAGRFYDTALVPLREGDVITGAIGVATDITSRREAELALHESEVRFRSTFEQAAVGLVHADAAGLVLLTNRAVRELSGYSEDELVGATALDLVHPEDRDAARAGMVRLLTGEQDLFEEDYRCVRKDGAVVWAHSTASVVRTKEGVPLYSIIVLEDLSQRLATEEQLRHAQKMDAVGQLTGGVAHDFNNLLTVVMGGLELALDPEEPMDEQREGLLQALDAVERGASLTHRLLAFSRRQALTPQPLDPGDLLDGMRKLLARTLGASVEIQISVAPDVGHCVVDHAQMESAVLNLALNARDAMPEGGVLMLRAEKVEVREGVARAHEAEPGTYVRVSVEDSGAGIPEHAFDRVFEPFYTTKEAGKGSGLGLSMVYGFTQQSDGFVSLESTEGAGTAVRLHLPAAQTLPEGRSGGAAAEHEPRGNGELVLLLEDDDMVRRLLKQLLEGLGYRVEAAERGSEALSILEREPGIELLLTDVMLPGGMNGHDVARKAEELRPGLPVVFASGYSPSELGTPPDAGGGVHLLQKPFSRAELAGAVSSALERRL